MANALGLGPSCINPFMQYMALEFQVLIVSIENLEQQQISKYNSNYIKYYFQYLSKYS